MKKFICMMIILALAVSVIFAKGNNDRDKKISGNITIYTSMYEDIIEAVKVQLNNKFPGCDIDFYYGGTGQIQAKIKAEKKYYKELGCDILMVSEPAYSFELKAEGMLHSYKSVHAPALAFDYDPDAYWYPVRISNMVLAYNPKKYSRAELPSTFYGFANDPRLQNAISISNPLTFGSSLAAMIALTDKYGYDYLNALGRQGVKIESNSAALKKLESGEYKQVMILEETILKKRQEENSDLEVIYPDDGIIVIPSNIMIINKKWSSNKNIRAAEAVAEWFLSPEGQDAIVNGWMHSARSDFTRLPYDSIPTADIVKNRIPVSWDDYFTHREEIKNKFEEYVTRRK